MTYLRLAPSDSSLVYHNVAEFEETPEGLLLHRVPAAWRQRFPEATAFRATQAGGVELRFCSDTRYIALDLHAENHVGYTAAIALYHGYRNVGLFSLTTPIHDGRVVLLDREETFEGVLDAPWRMLLPYGARTALRSLYLSNDIGFKPVAARPVRWLAHGDSITHGAHALCPGMTYVNQVADALGWDAINLGFGGSAWADAPVAEYIASRQDWDILSLAIGTNSVGGHDAAADYRAKYDRFLSIIRQAHPTKPILCLTPFWRRADGPPPQRNPYGDIPQDYRDAITAVVTGRMAEDANLRLLDGLTLIGDGRGLTIDLLHPDPHGMATIARGIAPVLQEMMR